MGPKIAVKCVIENTYKFLRSVKTADCVSFRTIIETRFFQDVLKLRFICSAHKLFWTVTICNCVSLNTLLVGDCVPYEIVTQLKIHQISRPDG